MPFACRESGTGEGGVLLQRQLSHCFRGFRTGIDALTQQQRSMETQSQAHEQQPFIQSAVAADFCATLINRLRRAVYFAI